ncbi:Conserved_hypothetical protein [Hexamita inflata]|uniref:Uncharacterized protein n=1 Tax=Hexamita inflata TaxID=28002 RepID=A0AA86PYJ3_9EUKA|nr:Conserved hypothetical protein [Hexamita inflata]
MHFLGIAETDESHNGVWIASQLKIKIEMLRQDHNIIVTCCCQDSAQCNVKAIKLLNGESKDYKDLTSEDIRNTKLSQGKVVMSRCTAHIMNLILKDYIKQFDCKKWIDDIAKLYGIPISVCETRWTTFNNAIEKIKKHIPNITNWEDTYLIRIHQDMEIIRLVTIATLELEGNYINVTQVQKSVDSLKDGLTRMENYYGLSERIKFAKDFLKERQISYIDSHLNIVKFLHALDPLGNVEFLELNVLTQVVGAMFYSEYITEGANQIDDQRKQLVERAKYFEKQQQDKLSDFINYLKNIWTNNEHVRTFLLKVEVMSISSCGIERVFSFFHRTTSHFLRKQISSTTLSALAYVYVDKIQPEMQQWKASKTINPDKSYETCLTLYECPTTEPDENSIMQGDEESDNI